MGINYTPRRGSLYGGGGGRKATPGAVKMREKNSIFSMKKQHPKTHTPLYLELLIPLKIMLINYGKNSFFGAVQMQRYTGMWSKCEAEMWCLCYDCSCFLPLAALHLDLYHSKINSKINLFLQT